MSIGYDLRWCLKGWVGGLLASWLIGDLVHRKNLIALLDSYSVFPNRCVSAFSVFLSAPNKHKDLSKNQMCFENIFRLKKFFRSKGLTEDACRYNTVKVKGYGESLGLLRVGMTLRRPLAVRSRELECRCFRRRNKGVYILSKSPPTRKTIIIPIQANVVIINKKP